MVWRARRAFATSDSNISLAGASELVAGEATSGEAVPGASSSLKGTCPGGLFGVSSGIASRQVIESLLKFQKLSLQL